MVGSLLGLRFGLEAIPAIWKANLLNYELILQRGQILADMTLKVRSAPVPELSLEALIAMEKLESLVDDT